MTTESLMVWAGRAAWAALPLTAGPAFGAALHDWAIGPRTTATGGLWVAWLITLVAALVPHPAALTTWRALAPAAATALVLAALAGHVTAIGAVDAVGALACAFAPATAAVFVNGPAYANERRFPLRPPRIALVGPAAAAWLLLIGAPAAAALLLADGRWVIGGIVAIIGAATAAIAGRALHGLSRRWLVFVPAGLVVHDPLTLADPVLFQRPTITGVGPAPAGETAPRLDLTAGGLGLVLEVRLREPTTVLVVTRPGRKPTAESVAASTLLVAPTRAAAVLLEAAERGYQVS